MQLFVRHGEVAGSPVVEIEGLIDLASIPELADHLTRAIHLHPGVIVGVDLDAVSGLDDCGLGVLLGAAARARDGGGDLVIVCSNDRIRRRIADTRLDQAVEVRERLVG